MIAGLKLVSFEQCKVIAPFALNARIVTEKAKKQPLSLSTLVLQRDAALVSILGFAVCLAPPGDAPVIG